MKMKVRFILSAVVVFYCFSCGRHAEVATTAATDSTTKLYREQHRPQFHFSPHANWMNDPNGMVFYDGVYHLFYQYFPDGNVWGPMHWGHASSRDLVHWQHLPIALYPDSLGFIFSGSAVVDKSNSSGLGSSSAPPLVAIFTYHAADREKAGASDYQSQGIAYSVDGGNTWTKYQGNPVIANQGVKDFRDPKVFWHEPSEKWVMILAAKDRVELWGSANLKEWKKLSDFGSEYGAHGGVWECPDLVKLKVEGSSEERWMMIVSLNPGGPNGGSATQYFTGEFDGVNFKPDQAENDVSWLDYGPDNYAGVTWSNAPDDRHIFLGWMSNWLYAEKVPTTVWRSAMTLPRELSLTNTGERYLVKSRLSPEIETILSGESRFTSVKIGDSTRLDGSLVASRALLSGVIEARDFSFRFSNKRGEELITGYDATTKRYFIDRSKAGKNDFSDLFRENIFAPRFSNEGTVRFTIAVDVSSIEVFYDDGLTVMTATYFPDEPLTDLTLSSRSNANLDSLSMWQVESIWREQRIK